jgi:xanthine dehydrogenase YagR molybdenum-binding subunit
MAQPNWPPADQRALLGKRISRVDGPVKTTGAARYSYDINRPETLYAILVPCLHPKAQIASVDASAAERLPGVRAVWVDKELKEINYAGAIVAAVAADTEEIAREAAALVKIEAQAQPHQVDDTDVSKFEGRESRRETGNLEEGFQQAEVTVNGEYGLPVITHCCLEPHGQVTEIRDGDLFIWPSTQNVSGFVDPPFTETTGFPANKIHVDCQYMGGGFGSKFNYDKWGTIGALLSKQTGRPVKLMLDRDLELMIAGSRPSAYAKIKVGAKRDGTLTAVDAEIWGTGGASGYNAPPVPYVFTKIPNTRQVGKGIRTNRGPQRAWRAPNHPQGCFLTMSALEDAAAALRMDALEFFLKNLQFTDRPEVYEEELKIAAELIRYREKAHLRGESGPGPVKRGLGVSIHTWGGRGHPSACDVTLNPDGSVEVKIGTQDLGVGTRTTIGIVIAETLGLPLDAVMVHIGKNEYPRSGASGGSTTIGGVSTSSRLAATDALNALLELVSARLNVPADQLEAVGGQIRQKNDAGKSMAWKDACALMRTTSITKRGTCNPNESERAGFISANVGGAQIADVSVDIETGVVTINEMVAVQDCGLIVDLKTAESQVFGALIMGITYALFEEAVYDRHTGRMLNADMEFYRLAGIKDVGQLKVQMMTGNAYDGRGVIGLGEPPVVSPGAAIANAVANACGVRVPHLPLTPDRVLTALQKGESLA